MSAAPGQASLFGPEPEPKPAVPHVPTAPAPGRTALPSRPDARPPRAPAATDSGKTSPMMEQYLRAKAEAPDALLFFRMGDFYELFGEDAKVASRALGITLTSRAKGEGALPMAGVPVKAYEGYLAQLIRQGFRVAICDQMSDPKLAKGIVDRAVTRIVTAGTLYEDDLLDRRTSNWLLAIAPGGAPAAARGTRHGAHADGASAARDADDGATCGLAWLDVSTGDFRAVDVPLSKLADEVARLDPAEILLPESLLAEPDGPMARRLAGASRAPLVRGAEWTFQAGNALTLVREQLRVATLAGFGFEDTAPCVRAAGAVLAYVRETQRGALPAVSALRRHDPGASAGLDRATRHCLELLATQRDGRREGSLLSVLDRTATAMGARLLREWLIAPLAAPAPIRARQLAVEELLARRDVHVTLLDALGNLPDLERIATRLLAGRASPRDLAALRNGLRLAPALRAALAGCDSAPLAAAGTEIVPLPELLDVLERGLLEQPAPVLHEGGLIARGWNARLDELVALRENGAAAIARFQAEEIARSGIASLKVQYNRVFGYSIEIGHAHAAKVPDNYVRKQTLAGAERYVTTELKSLEHSLLTADEQARTLEHELFLALRDRATQDGEALRALARAVARVDVLCSFCTLAAERGWVRPEVDDGDVIDIRDGRHPVLEALLPPGVFVPNDVRLDQTGARLLLVTGPNMAGKSTYIRQVALLVLLAQIGSFVPAASAHVGVVDRIFTRIGSADDLSSGASTFMVEMTETAAILNNASRRSLVLLDEVGRGTSTWDGLSLAWAICEYLVTSASARTLFATHYHELMDLADELPAVRNLHVAVHEQGEDVVFLHRIEPGGTDRSYGLHVARLAGVPRPVIERARKILGDLQARAPDLRPGVGELPAGAAAPTPRQELLRPPGAADPRKDSPERAVLDALLAVDTDDMTPLDALLLLRELGERLRAT